MIKKRIRIKKDLKFVHAAFTTWDFVGFINGKNITNLSFIMKENFIGNEKSGQICFRER